MITTDAIEYVARRMCEEIGLDPDEIVDASEIGRLVGDAVASAPDGSRTVGVIDEPAAQEKILEILRQAAAIYNKDKVPA